MDKQTRLPLAIRLVFAVMIAVSGCMPPMIVAVSGGSAWQVLGTVLLVVLIGMLAYVDSLSAIARQRAALGDDE